MSEVAIICLGANGDIINALPIALDEHRKGNKVTFVVSREYETILDGVSYCQRIALDLHYSMPMRAHDYAKSLARFNRILIAQTYGTQFKAQTDCFQKEVYRICDRLDDFGNLDLVFDQRCRKRELQLSNRFPKNKPWILYNAEGKSSPFPYTKHLEQLVCSFSDRFDIINIGTLRAERFFDLLGLFERASALVTIDSGPLHLARASNVPVISLITDRPTSWYGAVPPPNSRCAIRYGRFHDGIEEIRTVLNSITPVSLDRLPEKRLFHVYSEFPVNGDTKRRNNFASTTWEREYRKGAWVPLPLHDSELKRSSRNIGDQRGVPFIKDILNKAADISEDHDIIVLTNRDTCLATGTTEAIVSTLSCCEGVAAHRYDFHHKLFEHYNPNQAMLGNWYCGFDLFAFTRGWWLKHRDEYPDMLLGTEAWDWIMRELIRKYGGHDIHYGLAFHEFHSSLWYQPHFKNSNPAQLHNIRLARQFLRQNNLPLNEIAD